jgi:hypothetical protein
LLYQERTSALCSGDAGTVPAAEWKGRKMRATRRVPMVGAALAALATLVVGQVLPHPVWQWFTPHLHR